MEITPNFLETNHLYIKIRLFNLSKREQITYNSSKLIKSYEKINIDKVVFIRFQKIERK